MEGQGRGGRGLNAADYAVLLDLRCAIVDSGEARKHAINGYVRRVVDHMNTGEITQKTAADMMSLLAMDCARARKHEVCVISDILRRLEHRLPAGQLELMEPVDSP